MKKQEDQPIPDAISAPRSCENCAFSREFMLAPPAIGRGRECRFNPPGVLLVPVAPGQANLTAFFPPVNASMLCNQHKLLSEIANAKGSPTTGPAN